MNPRGRHALWRGVGLVAGVALFAGLYAVHPPLWYLLPVTAVELALLVVGAGWRPDGLAPGLAVAGAVVWWLAGGSTPWWQAGLAAVALAVYWLATVWSAEAPPWSDYAPGMLRRRIRLLLVYVATVCAGALAVGLCIGVGPLPVSPLWAAAGVGTLLVGLGVAAVVVADGER